MENIAPDRGTYEIRFDCLSAAAANQAALSLETFLLDLDQPGVEIKTTKDATLSQDFGCTLVLLLGTKAAIEISKGIADWLRRRPDAAGLVIMDVDGNRVEIRGPAAGSVDVARIAEALGHRDAR